MTLVNALSASCILGQAVNRSGISNVMVVENADALVQVNGPAIWYGVNVMKDLITRNYFEPVYEGHQDLANIERFLRQPRQQPSTDDMNPAAWEAVRYAFPLEGSITLRDAVIRSSSPCSVD